MDRTTTKPAATYYALCLDLKGRAIGCYVETQDGFDSAFNLACNHANVSFVQALQLIDDDTTSPDEPTKEVKE